MKTVLFVAYDFPPTPHLGAALRSAAFVRQLPGHGWRPLVVANHTGEADTSDMPVSRLKSLTPVTRPYELTPYGWAASLGRFLEREVNPADVDLCYVSCPPFPHAMTLSRWAARHGLPLVTDFRDAWSLDPYQEGSRLKRFLYRRLFPRWERRLVERTALLILNTPSSLSAHQDHYPEHAGRMICLPNGYDEEDFPDEPVPLEPEFRLLHAGRFGIGARSPDHLLQGVRLARQRGCPVLLDILGNQSEPVLAQIEATDLGDAVTVMGQVDHREATRRMCGASALVLIQAPGRGPIQAVAGKTYDYLRAGRPVLAIGPPGDNLDLIRNHVARHECPVDEPGAIAEAICRLYRDWDKGGLEAPSVDGGIAERFERRVLTARLAAHFDRLAGGAV